MSTFQTATHWGVYDVTVKDGRIGDIRGARRDVDPSPIGQSLRAVQDELRITQPMVRRSYLDRGPRRNDNKRGEEPFVPVDWDTALDLAATALKDAKARGGNEAIYAGSYGWGSAGRFHHPQSQIHRFLNMYGGYVRSVNTYSCAAMEVIIPHVLCHFGTLAMGMTRWDELARHGQLVVAFGGLSVKNMQVNGGGVANHSARSQQEACRTAGVRFINISPLREDSGAHLAPEWLALRPGSDVALMMGLAHTLVAENLHDRDFLERCCVGFDRFRAYLMGETDGVAKDADWAAAKSEIPAPRIRELAREIAANRTLITASWSVQRADHGEQAHWMAITLAAMSGSMGKPGGGFGTGYGAVQAVGRQMRITPVAPFPQGANPVKAFIPVARIADLLLNPGAPFDYNGEKLTYPDIELVYWCGGNPFHHHQDLTRLTKAWNAPSTVIVHEPWWNAVARRADIVFPATTALERNDFAIGNGDDVMVAMHQAIPPVAQARNDFDVFSALSERLGFGDKFTEGLGEMGWIRRLYTESQALAVKSSNTLPDFETFWREGSVEYSEPAPKHTLCEQLRADPAAHPLSTPSGKVEIFSETIAAFDYDDCRGHPTWFEPVEWLGAVDRYPLHLVSNQPKTRLHSQLDNGETSQRSKVSGREPALMNTADAAARGIKPGDVIRLYNARGACLAGVSVSDDIRPGVVQLATGAWFDPDEDGMCRHGNPNVLTRDKGTSRLAQGPIAHTCLVEVERFVGPLPAVGVSKPPPIEVRGRAV